MVVGTDRARRDQGEPGGAAQAPSETPEPGAARGRLHARGPHQVPAPTGPLPNPLRLPPPARAAGALYFPCFKCFQ
jgi:hypothetical protein